MALRSYTVTMTGSPVQATLTGSTTTGHQPFKYLRIENEIGNAVVQYGPSAVTSTVYAGSVLANTATIDNSVTIGPFDTTPSNIEEFFFLGTNAQKIHLTAIT